MGITNQVLHVMLNEYPIRQRFRQTAVHCWEGLECRMHLSHVTIKSTLPLVTVCAVVIYSLTLSTVDHYLHFPKLKYSQLFVSSFGDPVLLAYDKSVLAGQGPVALVYFSRTWPGSSGLLMTGGFSLIIRPQQIPLTPLPGSQVRESVQRPVPGFHRLASVLQDHKRYLLCAKPLSIDNWRCRLWSRSKAGLCSCKPQWSQYKASVDKNAIGVFTF